MAGDELKLGKGTAFVKHRLKRLRQEEHTWEADFRVLPKPITQSETHYLGVVVSEQSGSVLAQSQVEGRPSVNDLATLLAGALRQPLTGKAHRPRRLHVRGHHQWRELFPHLEELGIDVSVQRELPKVEAAYGSHLQQIRGARRATLVKPTVKQTAVEQTFPSIAKWVRGTATSRSGIRSRSASWSGRWITAGWCSRTTKRTRWPRRWPLWRRDWPSILSGRTSSNPVGDCCNRFTNSRSGVRCRAESESKP